MILQLIIIIISAGTGRFEISDKSTMIVNGLVRVIKNPAQEKVPVTLLPEDDNEEEVMNTKDIYKELRLRGYQYLGSFRSLKSASISGKKGHIVWMGNWVTFLDNMLQIMILGMNTKDLYVPTRIQKIVIDTKLHQQKVKNLDPKDRRKSKRHFIFCFSHIRKYSFDDFAYIRTIFFNSNIIVCEY